MTGFLERLAQGERIAERVVVVVAHPGDEVLAAGSRMDRMEDLTVVHITDGSPRDMEEARRLGFDTREDYAAARRREVVAAMEALGAEAELRCYWHPDKESILHGAAILDELAEELDGAAAVVTHAYDHSHPDHDTAALCVSLAVARLRGAGRPAPDVFEFPALGMHGGQAVLGRFVPLPSAPETVLPMSPTDQTRRRAALAAHRSQPKVTALADDWEERLRPAPPYDFRGSAPNGVAWYDRLGWTTTLAMWRAHADALLDREGA